MSAKVTDDLPDALRFFDSLPDSAHVKQPVVEALTASSPATIWRHVNAGILPKPYKFGLRGNGWNVGELRRAFAARKAKS
jgi:predicted DNA-binding transcriptional regulator AlpA